MAIIKFKCWPKYTTRASDIESVEVERETGSTVWIKGRRHSKTCEYASYFDTWADAHAAAVAHHEAALVAARRQLQYAQDRLGNVKGMRGPATTSPATQE